MPSFFSDKDAPYYLLISDYTEKSAGVRAMYYLCHALNLLGQEAYILGSKTDVNHLRTPSLKISDFNRHRKSQRVPIIIYPEVVFGNPLEMPFIVRWLLNKPGVVGGSEELNDGEMIFTYADYFVPEGMSLPLLKTPLIDRTVFNNDDNPYDKQRQGKVYYAHKYLIDGGELTEHVKDARSLCQDVELTRQELAEILRRSELLYCYEASSIIGEAQLCGCPVAIIPTSYTDKKLGRVEGAGLAPTLSEEDLQHAFETIANAPEDFDIFEQECWLTIKGFIKDTQAEYQQKNVLGSDELDSWGGEIYDILKTQQGAEIETKTSRADSNKAWLNNNYLSESRAAHLAERMMTLWHKQPTFHLFIVVNAHELALLSDTLDSLAKQLYKSWGLTILSSMPAPDVFNDVEPNIEWVMVSSEINESIENSVKESSLDWLIQILPGDILEPHALLSFAETINFYSDCQLIYCDEIVDAQNNDVLFKPDFNLDLLHSQSYIGRSVAVSREAFEQMEGYSSFAYVQNTDLAFRVFEKYGDSVIQHIPHVLWTSYAHKEEKAIRQFNELAVRKGHLVRSEIEFNDVKSIGHGCFEVEYPIQEQPLVSILIVNKDNPSHLSETLESLQEVTSYPNYELVIVDQDSEIEDTPYIYQMAESLFGDKLNIVSYEHANYAAAMNFGFGIVKGQYIVVLTPAMTIVDAGWLDKMLAQLLREQVAVVGAKITDNQSNILHAGGVLGLSDDLEGCFQGEKLTDHGYMNRLICVQEYPAVSSLCFMTTKRDFNAVNGFDEDTLAKTKHLIEDYCLKQRERSKKIIWTPFATICFHIDWGIDKNAVGQVYDVGEEVDYNVLMRWQTQYRQDISFNQNLSLSEKCMLPETRMICDMDTRHKFKPRIMMYPFDNQGVGHYRVRSPLYGLAKEGFIELIEMPNFNSGGITNICLPSLFELNRLSPDVIFMHQMLTDEHYEFLQKVKRYTSIKLVLGIDDLVSNLTAKSAVRRGFAKDLRFRLRRTLKLCDCFVVSTQPLLDTYRDFHDDIRVVPNSLPDESWLGLERKTVDRDNGKPRVGWIGGCSHDGDLAYMVDVVKEMAEEVDWVFMGMCPDEIRDDIKEFHGAVSIDQYPQKVAELDLDLAIAPLEPHPFNECKSNLRLLEYGVMGWPVVCSDIAPYRENNPPVDYADVTNAKEWVSAIRKAVADPQGLKQKGEALQKWVLENYLLSKNLSKWLKVLKS